MKKALFTILSSLILMLAIADETKVSSNDLYKGMGRIVLQKNLVNGVNTLTQAMLPIDSGENTIYVIQHNYVLGENITIPANCVLEFEGGSLTAGDNSKVRTITGRNTAVQAGLYKIFDIKLSLEGTWKVEYGFPEWFGARGDGVNDDTEAFYAVLSYFSSIFLNGKYSIDFKDVDLENKTIVGKWRTKSGIAQRNSNRPFALVKTYNFLNRFTIFAQNNTRITDVLHFGYSDGKYNDFSFSDLTNIVFVSDNNTIPLHFNMKNGGNSDCFIENVRMYHCYIGVWYEFEKTYGRTFGWLTQCTMKDVTIYDPSKYGFKWDALSMYDQGKVVNGKTIQTMWCYNNNFENIGVDIVKDGATGFYIGQGMGMLVNPMVFNDIPASRTNAIGYSVEFAPTGSPIRPKMVTNIIGGSFEGQIKNMDYAYMNNINNLKITFRNNRGSKDRFITLDSGSIPDAYDLNILGSDILNQFTIKNASLSVGTDEFGDYLKISRINPKVESYFACGLTKQSLMDNGVKNGLYTLQTIAESNLGGKSSGFYFQNPEYRYAIDGMSNENMILGKDGQRICNSVFVNVTDNIKKQFVFGYYSAANSDLDWVKIYSIRLLPGIVGKYLMEKPKSFSRETINISKEFGVGNGSLRCSASFSSIKEATNNSCPISVRCEGRIPPGVAGTIVTIGKLQYYSVPRKIVFQVYDTDEGDVVGMCFVETDGTFKFKYTKQVRNATSVYGSV